jgi:phosphatidylinositol alpha-1,6-mannosyltransferase
MNQQPGTAMNRNREVGGHRRHLLVTNDFPPKIGGIQNYLWELWRRLPDAVASVYTTPYGGTAAFDSAQPFAIERSPEPWLIPYPWLGSRVRRLQAETASELVLFDPAVPVGALGPGLGLPYGVVLHGAEVTIPGRLPVLRSVLGRTLRGASLVVSAGRYALDEAERCAGGPVPSVVIPPGVDSERFRPATADQRAKTRAEYGLAEDDVVLAVVSRLVPRKGMETLIRASAEVARRASDDAHRRTDVRHDLGHDLRNDRQNDRHTDRRHEQGNNRGGGLLRVVIGGTGRSRNDLVDLARRLNAPVDLPGRLSDEQVVELYGAADMMAMLCNERWFGLEQEGFGIVFLEAAAAGIPQIAGRSGGAHEAVADGETGLIVDDPLDVRATADAIEALIDDPQRRRAMGVAARTRAVERFDYARLATDLTEAIDRCLLRPAQ